MHRLFPNWINGLSTKRPDSGSFCRNFSFCDPCEACSRCNFTSCFGVSRGHHYNPNGDPAFPRSHSGASYRVRKHYTAECVAPHRRHRTPRFGCLNPNGRHRSRWTHRRHRSPRGCDVGAARAWLEGHTVPASQRRTIAHRTTSARQVHVLAGD